MKNKSIKKIAVSALLAAICFIVTRVVALPAFYTKGYINIGDCAVLVAAFVPGGIYGALAAAIGSALSDLTAGYAVYVPATFIIKGIMAFAAGIIFKKANKAQNKKNRLFFIIFGCAISEILMVSGYFIFEIILYGPSAIASVVGNLIQAVTCAVLGAITVYTFSSNKTLCKISENLFL